MLKDLIFFYFLISYSIGIVALIFSVYLCRAGKSGLYVRYFFIVLSLFIVMVFGTVSNYFDWNQKTIHIFRILQFIMYLCPVMLVYLLPDFFSRLFNISYKRFFGILCFFVSAGLIIVLSVCRALDRMDLAHLFIMSFLGAAAVYSVAVSFIFFRKVWSEPFFSFFRQVTVIAVFFLPSFILLDFYPLKALDFLDVKGPLSLPLFYAVWNIIFIIQALKYIMNRRGTVPEIPDSFLE